MSVELDRSADERAPQDLHDVIGELPLAYFELDEQGVIRRINPAATRLFQGNEDVIVGMTLWDLMAADDARSSRESFFCSLASTRDPLPSRCSFYTVDRGFRVYDNYSSLIRDEGGAPVGMRWLAIDVTETANTHEEASRAVIWLDSILASLREALLVTDALGIVRYVNPAMEQLSGWPAEELVGGLAEDCLPMPICPQPGGQALAHRHFLATPCEVTACLVNSRNEEIAVEVRTCPLIDRERGCTLGIVAVARTTP